MSKPDIKVEEVVVETLGSPVGTKIVKAMISNKGLKMKVKGTPWEQLNVAAALVDNVCTTQQATIEDAIEALVEILLQAEV